MSEYTVYVLKSLKDNKRYIGSTSNLQFRFQDHLKGLVKSTRNRRPLVVIYTEAFSDKNSAMLREKFFKSSKGRAFLKNLNC